VSQEADGNSDVPYYKIDSITADLVVQNSVSTFTGDTGLIDQTYYVNFLTEADVLKT